MHLQLQEKITELIVKKVPIISWLSTYTTQSAISDVLAGITVGLTLIPQAIAYASLAGLDPKYGLYSSIFGIFAYTIFGKTKQLSVGPTSIMALLCLTYTHDTSLDMVALLTFLTGLVQLTCGLLNLGFVVEFVSLPVVSGFTSATALIMASSQLKYFLGIKYKSSNVVDMYLQIFRNIQMIKYTDLILGLSCVVLLILLKKLQDIKFNSKSNLNLSRVFWFLSTGRNAFILMGCSVITYILKSNHDKIPFALVGNIESGFPELSLPKTHTIVNGTEWTIIDMVSHLGTGIFLTPLVGLVANVAIAKAFSEGKIVDASQEMIALGMGNLAGSLITAMPVASSFSRSAVNNSSGVKSTIGGIYTGIIVLLSLSLLTPYLQYIPQAGLAAVLVCAVLTLVEIEIVFILWNTNKRNLVTLLTTFLTCLLIGIEVGLLCGICMDIFNLLYFNARPSVPLDKKVNDIGQEFWLFEPSCGLLFPTVDYLREVILSKLYTHSNLEAIRDDQIYIIINCVHVNQTDYTAAKGLISLAEDLKKRKCPLVIINATKAVTATIENVNSSSVLSIYDSYEQFQGSMEKDFHDMRNSIDTLSELHLGKGETIL